MIASAKCSIRNHKSCLGVTERTAVEPFHPCECQCHTQPAKPAPEPFDAQMALLDYVHREEA